MTFVILLPKMRQRKGRAEDDTIHADKRSISRLTPDLQGSWNNSGGVGGKYVDVFRAVC